MVNALCRVQFYAFQLAVQVPLVGREHLQIANKAQLEQLLSVFDRAVMGLTLLFFQFATEGQLLVGRSQIDDFLVGFQCRFMVLQESYPLVALRFIPQKFQLMLVKDWSR